MWRLQGGSYIPGFSGQAFGAGLQRDVTKTRKDQAKKAASLRKYMNKRGALGKWGAKIGSGLLGAALGSTMGPVGLMIAKAGGAGIGSLIGGSKKLAGEAPSMKPGAGTGLLGSTYEQLGEAKGGIDEAMRGQAMGAAGSQLMSGLTGMAGSELKSGFGKMLAGKGINIGASPELGGGLSADAKAFHESMGPSSALDTLSKSISPDSSGTNIGAGFGLPQASQFGLGSDLDLTSNLTSDASYTGDIYRGIGPFRSQQGGYMQGYQEGGQARGALMRAFEAADLNRDKIMGEAAERQRVEKSGLEEMLRLAGGMKHAKSAKESEDIYQKSLGDMDKGNLKSLLGLVGGAKDDIQMGPWKTTNTGRRRTFSKIFSGPENRGVSIEMDTPDIRGDIDVSGTMADRKRPEPLEPMMNPFTGEPLDELSGEDIPFEYLRDLRQGKSKNPYEDIVSNLEYGTRKPDRRGTLTDLLFPTEMQTAVQEAPSTSEYNIQDPMGLQEDKPGWQYRSNLSQLLEPKHPMFGMQMGGMMPGGVSNALPYNIGGSVQQQPMAYQLGGLLKYKRSPMMG